MINNPLLALSAILVLMSAIAYLQKYPIPVSDIKPYLAKLQHWIRNEDGEHILAYLVMCAAVVVLVPWLLSLI